MYIKFPHQKKYKLFKLSKYINSYFDTVELMDLDFFLNSYMLLCILFCFFGLREFLKSTVGPWKLWEILYIWVPQGSQYTDWSESLSFKSPSLSITSNIHSLSLPSFPNDSPDN